MAIPIIYVFAGPLCENMIDITPGLKVHWVAVFGSAGSLPACSGSGLQGFS